jgi:transcriptional regulator with XRE-family HTH domain
MMIMSDQFFPLRNEGGPLQLDGLAVYRARRAAGLTQAELARRMTTLGYFLTQPYLSLLENGRYRWGFSERMATAFAAALGVGVSELTGGRLMSRAEVQRTHELTSQVDDLVEPGAEVKRGPVAA